MRYVHFMSTTAGRVVRVVVGLVLIAFGVWTGGAGWVVAVIGLEPLAAGLFNFTLLAPFFHEGIRGATPRHA